MHEEIIIEDTEVGRIYHSGIAGICYFNREFNEHVLSMMKQENIREAIENRMGIQNIKEAIDKLCGYCLKYRKAYILCEVSNGCPISKFLNMPCYETKEWKLIMNSTTYKELRDRHKRWCRVIGLDVYKDEE